MYNNNYEFRYGDSTSISNFIHESNLIKMIKKIRLQTKSSRD